MTAKSPRQKSSKKSGKTLKEKRADKRAKSSTEPAPLIAPTKRNK